MLNMMTIDECFSETLLAVSVHVCDELELRVHVCCSQFSRNPPYRKRFSFFRTVMEGHSQKDSKGVFYRVLCTYSSRSVVTLLLSTSRPAVEQRKQLKLDASIIC